MKIYVVAGLEDDGACGDPECCGPGSSWSVVHHEAFQTREEAEIAAPCGLEVFEVELEISSIDLWNAQFKILKEKVDD